jgi:Ca2+-binding EF-hand superfamily protein
MPYLEVSDTIFDDYLRRTLHNSWNLYRVGSFPQEIQTDINALKEELRLSDTDTIGNWKAFLAATMDKNLVMREDKIKFAFDQFKHSDTDHLTLDNFAAIFESDTQAKEIFEFLDNDCDGKVSFEDFRNAMEEYIDINQEE